MKHGHCSRTHVSATYHSWHAMLNRCDNASHFSFPQYGGRGIVVIERWRDFRNFLADMGERPEGTSIERINVDGPYAPSNCKWATPSEQLRNRRPFRRPPLSEEHKAKIRKALSGRPKTPEHIAHAAAGRWGA